MSTLSRSFNSPLSIRLFQLPTSTTRQIGGRIFLERDEDKDSGYIPLDLYHILYLNLCALPVRDEDKDSGFIPLDLYPILYLNLCALPVRDEDKD